MRYLRKYNESLSEKDLIETIKIELEDCTDFELSDVAFIIEPFSKIASLLITEDFGINTIVKKMIDDYISSTRGYSAENYESDARIRADRKAIIYGVIRSINNRIFSKIARKYDIENLGVRVQLKNFDSYIVKVVIDV